MTPGPVTFNRRGTKVKPVLRCSDGDPLCDLDGMRDGTCTFGVAVCFGNADPRTPRCEASAVHSIEVVQPRRGRSLSVLSLSNIAQLERSLGALGLEMRRRGRVIVDAISPVGGNRCSSLIRLETPAPKGGRGKAVRQKFRFRSRATDGRRDNDRFVLECR